MKINTALILCAGFGKRLNPITLKTPKPLLKIGDNSMLEKCINLIEKLGIKKILINTFYLKDQFSQFLESKGISNYLVEVGGEILAKGKNADRNIWRVGVDKPTDSIDSSERFLFILDLEDKALATSGNYRKFYQKDGNKYSHTINPFTAFPAQNRLLSVSVVHDNCMLADAYATAFMTMGVKKTKQFVETQDEIEVYLVYTGNDGTWKSFISSSMQKRIIN